MIKQDTEKAKTQYENLLTEVSQAKRGLESALSQWGDFDRYGFGGSSEKNVSPH
jgi:hypothetical protein